MPVYEYKCPDGPHRFDSEVRADRVVCIDHNRIAIRQFGWNMTKTGSSFEPHFNLSLGRWVTSRKDFNDGLKLASEKATVETGLHHDFTSVEIGDKDAWGIKSEYVDECKEHDAKVGLDARRKAGDYEVLK